MHVDFERAFKSVNKQTGKETDGRVHTLSHMHTRIYVSTHTRARVHTHTHTHHTHTHTHTHTRIYNVHDFDKILRCLWREDFK